MSKTLFYGGKMNISDQIKKELDNIEEEDFIITMSIGVREGEVGDGGKEIHVRSSSNKDG